MSGRIHIERNAQIARVVIDRQARANALDSAQLIALKQAFDDLGDEVRVVVLASAGDTAFVGGADLDELASLAPETARAFITSVHEACDAVRRCPVPVIARIQGAAIGAGLELAASCDIRIAAEGATFTMPEVRFGIPSVVEAALLPRLIGRGRAASMLLTGRSIDAATALEWALVERVVSAEELDAAIDDVCRTILELEPHAVREQKRLLHFWDEHSLSAGIAESIATFAACYRAGEPARRIGAFKAARKRRDAS